MSGRKEQKFLDALRDLFAGAKIEGDSGYVNLLRIKSGSYESVLRPALLADMETALEPFPNFREELFDKLMTCFERYLMVDETVSIEGDEVGVDLSALYPDIYLAETLSCLTGKWIRHIHADEVKFVDGTRLPLSAPDWPSVKPLLWW